MSMPLAGVRYSIEGEGDTSSSSDVCSGEVLVCNGDPACSSCMNTTSRTEFDECLTVEVRTAFNSTSMAGNCAVGRMAVCCAIEVSAYDCMENGAFLEYVACELLKFGCSSGEDLSCSEDSVGTWLRAIRGGDGVGSIADSPTSAAVFAVAVALVLFAAGISVGVVISTKRRPDSGSFSKVT